MEKKKFGLPLAVSSSFSLKSEASTDAILSCIHSNVSKKPAVSEVSVAGNSVVFKTTGKGGRTTFGTYSHGEITVSNDGTGAYKIQFKATVATSAKTLLMPLLILLAGFAIMKFSGGFDYNMITFGIAAVIGIGLLSYIFSAISLEVYLSALKEELKSL